MEIVTVNLNFAALPTEPVRALQSGGLDANGHEPEVGISDGIGNPCRHCLRDVPQGHEMLVLAYRPFPCGQPFAELGPIFLCANPCERHTDSPTLPAMFSSREKMLVRAYGGDDRIVYGSGQVVETKNIVTVASQLLERDETAYLHMRSASYNCYQCRIDKV
jgi:hypothetical protein